jgi:hypothetical protein
MAQDEHTAQKMKLSSIDQRIIFSFCRILPQVYTKGVGTVQFPLSRIKAFSSWDHHNSVGGVKNEIATFLERYDVSSKASINARFYGADRSEAKSVALACLQKSREFIGELHAFMSDFYSESLREGQEDESWSLTCKLVEGIFFQLNKVRAVAANAASIDASDQGKRIGLVLWGTLQTHKLMNDFREARFRRHPTVASNLMLHLFSIQVSSSKMLTLQSEVAEWIRKSKLISITADKALEVAQLAKKK